MFEQDIIYRDIKGKKIQIICESDIKIEGVCIFNPKVEKNVKFYSMYHCLSIKVENLPDLLTIWKNNPCYVTDNNQFPYGLFVEVIKTSTLVDINKTADTEEAEHVTLKIRNNPDKFNIKSLPSDRDYPKLSLTIDTREDALTLMPIFNSLKAINPHFGLSEIANIKI